MGLPTIEIDFAARAETAIARSQNGTVAVILIDNTKTGDENASYKYNYETDIAKGDWNSTNTDYLNKVFLGAPNKVLVERVEAAAAAEADYDAALGRLKNKDWDWLCVPGIDTEGETGAVKKIADWVKTQRAAHKTFKAVLPYDKKNEFGSEGIVAFATDGIKVGATSYSTAEYCGRIAGLLAGLPLNRSATYAVLAEVDSIAESTTPDDDIDAGKFILVNDGEKIKVGRGVNSLKTLSEGQTEDMKSIKIVEGMDLIRKDIRESFEANYIGLVNSYDNKMMFIAAVNQYLSGLVAQGVLYDQGENTADIDVAAQRDWLADKYDISDYTDDEIRTANTGSYIFAYATVTFANAIEDLKFSIYME